MEDGSSYGQYCPIVRAVEVLGERWTLLLVRDMLVGATRFNELARGQPGLSRSLLSKRLRQLEAAGIVDKVRGQYLLTAAGRELEPIVFGLGEWGARWAFGDPRDDELDPELLLWWARGRIDTAALPAGRTVLAVELRAPVFRAWLVVDDAGVSVCKTDPGFDIDATISADLAALYQVWLGRVPLSRALHEGTVVFHGEPGLVRRLPEVLALSPVADMVARHSGAAV